VADTSTHALALQAVAHERSKRLSAEQALRHTQTQLHTLSTHVVLLEKLQKVFETERNEHVVLQEHMASMCVCVCVCVGWWLVVGGWLC
jgi:hypothetical protein